MGTAAGSGSMAQTLLVVVLFVAAMALLPWLVRRLKQRQSALGGAGAAAASRVLSAISLGPQQRLVTVEVGAGAARTCLVLGVTAQQITCLHVLPAPASAPTSAAASVAGTAAPIVAFSQAMATAQARAQGAAHHG